MSQSIFVLTQAIKELCRTSSGQQFSALSTVMVCCTPSYYAHSLGPVRVARILICKACNFYIASMNDLLSRGYSGTHSAKAGLFENASNVSLGERKILLMHSGAYTVREIRCINCDSYIGWKIVQAHEPRERWKEDAYVLERHFLLVGSVVEGEDWDLQLLRKPAAKLKVIDDLKMPDRRLSKIRVPSSVSAR